MREIEELREVLEDRIQSIEFKRPPADLYDPISYTLQSNGKRIRPVLFLLACQMFSEKIDDAIDPAIGFEIFHNFTLLHDDIMDNASVRRGMPTVHEKWNVNTAILSGDAMMVEAYKFVSHTPGKYLGEVLALFSETASGVCEGQMFDMLFEKQETVSEAEYLEMIKLKTSVLLAASLKAGAIIGGANNKNAEKLYLFGLHLGLAFQLKDDWLDVFGDPAVFGKKPGGDIVENKKTFLLIKALEKAQGADKMELEFWLKQKEFDRETKVVAVTNLYRKLEVDKLTDRKAEEHFNEAFKQLKEIDIEEYKKRPLNEMGKILLERIK